MFSFLKNVAADIQKSIHGRPAARGIHRVSLHLESLEDRQLLSASPLLVSVNPYGAVAQTQTLVSQTYPSITLVVPVATPLVSDVVLQTPINASLVSDTAANPLVSDRVWQTPIDASLYRGYHSSPVFHPEVPIYLHFVQVTYRFRPLGG